MNTGGYITDHCRLDKVADAATAATSTVNATGVDMAENGGWDGVLFFTSFATPAADNAIHAEQSADDADADAYADLAGSEVDVGASDEDQFIDIQCPRERYVRCVALRGTSTALGDIWALRYRGRTAPIENVLSGTQNGKQLYRPAEGTK